MRDGKSAKPRRKQKKVKKGTDFTRLFVGIGLVACALVVFVLAAMIKSKDRGLVMLFGLLFLIGGAVFCVMQFVAPYLKRDLEFGEDAVRVRRSQDGKLLGQIPYSNIATVQVDFHVRVGRHPDTGEEVEIARDDVVAIRLWKLTEKNTFWPYQTAAQWNDYDFYIPNDTFPFSLTQLCYQLDERVHVARANRGSG